MLDVIWGLFKLLLGLALVVALAALATRALGRGLPAPQGRGRVRVLGHLYLGGRRGLSLVRVGGAVLVLGVTDHAVNLLDKVTDAAEVAALEEAAAAPLVAPDWLDRFSGAVRERVQARPGRSRPRRWAGRIPGWTGERPEGKGEESGER